MLDIVNLIETKQEGSYWDFKKQWYIKDENGRKFDNLLHDIICMANNLTNNDGYIIIGVNEDEDYRINDISEDPNRKNTQKLVDFLKDKKFAGDIRPVVKVENIQLDEGLIDVIVVTNDNNTPYFLKETYGKVLANHIYTRIQDTNTPKDKSADIDKVEFLWKKRFGLTTNIIEKMELYISDATNWTNGPYGENYKFYNLFPEFTISYDLEYDLNPQYVFYAFNQYDTTVYFRQLQLKYHQTLLKVIEAVSIDGGRFFTPCPINDSIVIDNIQDEILFKYFEKDSFLYKLSNFFYQQDRNQEFVMARNKFFNIVLLFENEVERFKFKNYVLTNWCNKEKYEYGITTEHIPQINGLKKDAYKKEYKDGIILNRMLKEFRKQ